MVSYATTNTSRYAQKYKCESVEICILELLLYMSTVAAVVELQHTYESHHKSTFSKSDKFTCAFQVTSFVYY